METGKLNTDQQMEENEVMKQFTGLLGQQGMGEQSKDIMELFRYIMGMQVQLSVMTGELQNIREQLSQLQENRPKTVKERITDKAEDLQERITDLSDHLSRTKTDLVETASKSVSTFKDRGKAAMCKILQKGISRVRQMLAGSREKMAYLVADCQKTVNQMDSIGAELKQIGNSASNVGRLLSGKEAKEAQGEKQGVGFTRAINKFLKNIMANLQKNINTTGKAIGKLDRFSAQLENTIREAEKGGRTSVKDKLSQMKTRADQQKEAPGQARSREACI